MKKFKHHKYFPKEKSVQAYTFPYLCFECRKSFAKPKIATPRKCPECGVNLTMVSRKFAPPKTTDKAQWAKVKYLVDHGFKFQSIYAKLEDGSQQTVTYPANLRDARKFVTKYQEQAIKKKTKSQN